MSEQSEKKHVSHGVHNITIADDDDGQRLDRWLQKKYPSIPKGHIFKIIRTGQIRMDGKRVKADTRMVKGLNLRLPPMNFTAKENKGLTQSEVDFIKSLVIYDDGDIIAINKPAGLAVQGGTNIKTHVDYYLDGLKNKKDVRPRLVHRIDKDTSGVLLLARSAEMARELGNKLKSRDIRKYYWSITVPAMPRLEGTIDAPIGKGTGALKETMIIDREHGKRAITHYQVIESAGKDISFVCFWPKTGRTHQIRVHAQHIGCALLGDRRYTVPENPDKPLNIDFDINKRLHLHAQRVICDHPTRKGVKLDITAPLPKDLQANWNSLGFSTTLKDDPFAHVDV